MYILLLVILALLFLTTLSTNWPVKLYHARFLKRLAEEFGTAPISNGLLSQVATEIKTIFRGYDLTIRFVDTALDSLRSAHPGLELRVNYPFGTVMEMYRPWRRKREWGDFKQVTIGNAALDSQWFILSPLVEPARQLLEQSILNPLLELNQVEQVLINQHELIVRLRRYGSAQQVRDLVERGLRFIDK